MKIEKRNEQGWKIHVSKKGHVGRQMVKTSCTGESSQTGEAQTEKCFAEVFRRKNQASKKFSGKRP